MEFKGRRRVIPLDSKNRDNITMTTPSHYFIKTPVFSNIREMTLLTSEIRGTGYLIPSSANSFTVTFGGTIYTVALNIGNYTAAALATELQTRLTALSLGSWTVAVESSTQRLLITVPGVGIYTFDFSNNIQLGRILGFAVDTATTFNLTGGTIATISYPVDTTGYTYVYMLIKDCDGLSVQTVTKAVFAKIIFNNSQNGVNHSFAANVLRFPQGKTLKQLEIEFVTQDGTPYDFNGVNHSFTIEVLEADDKGRY